MAQVGVCEERAAAAGDGDGEGGLCLGRHIFGLLFLFPTMDGCLSLLEDGRLERCGGRERRSLYFYADVEIPALLRL